MKRLMIAAACVATMAAPAAAVTFDFGAIAGGGGFTNTDGDLKLGGEADWNTRVGGPSTGILDTASGISVIGSATTSAGGSALAYFDNNPGLGVCSVVTRAGQCNPANDDNVGPIGGSSNAGDGSFETLVLSFSRSIKLDGVTFKAEGHGTFNGNIKINGIDTVIAGGTLSPTGLSGSVFDFQYLPNAQRGSNEFYIKSVQVSAVPLPAGGVLLLTALGGLGLARRRRRAA